MPPRVFYEILYQKVMNRISHHQRRCDNHPGPGRRNIIGTRWGGCNTPGDKSNISDDTDNAPGQHILSNVKDSNQYYGSKKDQSHQRSNPWGIISEQSLNLNTNDFEVDYKLNDEIEPYESTVDSHVFVVVAEMTQDAFLDRAALAQMRYYQSSSIKGYKTCKQAHPQTGKPSCSQAQLREDHAYASPRYHPVHKSHYGCRSTHIGVGMIEILLPTLRFLSCSQALLNNDAVIFHNIF